MILTHHDGLCVRAQAGETTLVFGPVSKGSKTFKPTNFGADVAFISLEHPDMNGTEESARGEKRPFVISGPGEYEVKDVTASGFQTKSLWGGEERLNTVYALRWDGLLVFYCGALGDTDVPADLLEMDEPDILIIPVCGEGALSPSDAAQLAVKLEAKIVIPLSCGDAKAQKTFLKEIGAEDAKPVEKFTVKPRDVAGKENEVVILGE